MFQTKFIVEIKTYFMASKVLPKVVAFLR